MLRTPARRAALNTFQVAFMLLANVLWSGTQARARDRGQVDQGVDRARSVPRPRASRPAPAVVGEIHRDVGRRPRAATRSKTTTSQPFSARSATQARPSFPDPPVTITVAASVTSHSSRLTNPIANLVRPRALPRSPSGIRMGSSEMRSDSIDKLSCRIEDERMDGVRLLAEGQQLRVALPPLRRRLLDLLQEPASAVELSRRTGIPRQKLNYHLRVLEQAGLVELVETRSRRGCVERILRATSAELVVDPDLVGRSGPDPLQGPVRGRAPRRHRRDRCGT